MSGLLILPATLQYDAQFPDPRAHPRKRSRPQREHDRSRPPAHGTAQCARCAVVHSRPDSLQYCTSPGESPLRRRYPLRRLRLICRNDYKHRPCRGANNMYGTTGTGKAVQQATGSSPMFGIVLKNFACGDGFQDFIEDDVSRSHLLLRVLGYANAFCRSLRAYPLLCCLRISNINFVHAICPCAAHAHHILPTFSRRRTCLRKLTALPNPSSGLIRPSSCSMLST